MSKRKYPQKMYEAAQRPQQDTAWYPALGLICLGGLICLILSENASATVVAVFAVGYASLVMLLFAILLLKEKTGGKISFDEKGITAYHNLSRVFYSWDELQFTTFILTWKTNSKLKYIIVFSKTSLFSELNYTDPHRTGTDGFFMRKFQTDYRNRVYFDYDETMFREILPFIPQPFKEKLLLEEAELTDELIRCKQKRKPKARKE